MASLYLLGTGAALSDPHRTTTMLAFNALGDTLLVDCGGDVIQRLLGAGLRIETISGIVITHEHPDHVSGFPLFMEKIWLAGRRNPIPVYGIREALAQARRTFASFDTSTWEGLPPIEWHEFPLEEGAQVLESPTWSVTASPGKHGVPVVGLRVESKASGSAVVYSCDTEPFPTIERLARDADVLVHEATGEGPGHTSAEQAAAIASRSGAGRLLLVHLPPGLSEESLRAAREIYAGTTLGEELGRYEF